MWRRSRRRSISCPLDKRCTSRKLLPSEEDDCIQRAPNHFLEAPRRSASLRERRFSVTRRHRVINMLEQKWRRGFTLPAIDKRFPCLYMNDREATFSYRPIPLRAASTNREEHHAPDLCSVLFLDARASLNSFVHQIITLLQ